MKPSLLIVAVVALVAVFWFLRSDEGPGAEAMTAKPARASDSPARQDTPDLMTGRAPASEREPADAPAEGALEVPDASLRTALIVSVVDQRGAPIDGVLVVLSGSRQRVLTDAQGRCTLDVVPGVALRVHVSPEERYFPSARAEHPGVAAGETGELELIAVVPEGTFFGVVVAAEDGRSLPGVSVHARKSSGLARLGREPAPLWNAGTATTITDADGRFELALDEWGDGLAVVSSADRAPVLFEVDETFGRPENPRRLRLQRAARLVGRVDGVDGGTGGAFVRIACARYHLAQATSFSFIGGADVLWSGSIAPDGTFAVEGLPAQRPLQVSVEQGRKLLWRVPDPMTFAAGEERAVQWAIGLGATARVQALDADGAPQPNLRLALYTGDELYGTWIEAYHDEVRRLRTDAEGRARVGDLAPGEWAIGPVPRQRQGGEGPGPGDPAPVATRFTVPPGATHVDVTLRIQRGVTLSGRVIGPEGEVVSKGNVSARLVDGPSSGRLSLNENVAEDGTFVLGPLPHGRFALTAGPYGKPLWRRSEPIEMDAGAADIQLRLQSAGSVTVRIVDPITSEVLKGPVWIHAVDGGGYRGVHQNEAKEVVLGGLSAGVYHAVGVADDGRIGALRDVEILAGHDQGPFDIPVAAAGTVCVSYEGPAEYANYSIHQDGVKYGTDGVRSGTSATKAAPTGVVTVKLKVRPGAEDARAGTPVIERTRTVTVVEGEETAVEFEIAD